MECVTLELIGGKIRVWSIRPFFRPILNEARAIVFQYLHSVTLLILYYYCEMSAFKLHRYSLFARHL